MLLVWFLEPQVGGMKSLRNSIHQSYQWQAGEQKVAAERLR
ncbi:MAG: hypothetical protein Q9M50_15345 [Methylococcales bacterium]|nr:hypothetical protein [Methylococcales bacterium]